MKKEFVYICPECGAITPEMGVCGGVGFTPIEGQCPYVLLEDNAVEV